MGADDFDFDLEYLKPQGTVWFRLRNVKVRSEHDAELELEHAGRGTPARAAFDSAVLRNETNEQIARKLLPLVAKNWKNVHAADGSPLPCTADGLRVLHEKLLKAERGDKIDAAIRHTLDPDNFASAAPVQLGKA